jgi:hypothetical protein
VCLSEHIFDLLQTNLIRFLAHAWIVPGMKSKGGTSNGSRDTTEKVFCSAIKLSLFIDRLQGKLHIFLAYV